MMIIVTPALLKLVIDSSTARFRSKAPAAAACVSIANSPDTWYAATGTVEIFETSRQTSKNDPPGLTITKSAPSAISRETARRLGQRWGWGWGWGKGYEILD